MGTKRRNIIILSIVLAALLAVLLSLFLLCGDDTPEDETVDAFLESDVPPEDTKNTCDVPILMYHHLNPTESGAATITVGAFEAQIASLVDAGYTAVTLRDLVAFVDVGAPLPEKPIVITFDDGYMSNYEYAMPILDEHEMHATVFVIGYSFGADTYKDTGVPIIPHFGENEAREMVNSGVFCIQSHTYDMHASETIEGEDARICVLPLDGETTEEYESALREDIRKSRALIEGITGEDVFALAYPRGYYSAVAQEILVGEGVRVTLTTDEGTNTIVQGDPASLLGLKRYNVDASMTPEDLISKLENRGESES